MPFISPDGAQLTRFNTLLLHDFGYPISPGLDSAALCEVWRRDGVARAGTGGRPVPPTPRTGAADGIDAPEGKKFPRYQTALETVETVPSSPFSVPSDTVSDSETVNFLPSGASVADGHFS